LKIVEGGCLKMIDYRNYYRGGDSRFIGGPFIGGLLGGFLGSAILGAGFGARPFPYYPPFPTAAPFYPYGGFGGFGGLGGFGGNPYFY
jgi:hypothetical protein